MYHSQKTNNMKKISNLSEINVNTIEGRYLLAAIGKITSESQTDKTPDEVLEQCHLLQEEMFKDYAQIIDDVVIERPGLINDLQKLINKHSFKSEPIKKEDKIKKEKKVKLIVDNEIEKSIEVIEPGNETTNKIHEFKACMLKGESMMKEKKYDEALKLYEQACNINPESKEAESEKIKAGRWVKMVADL